MQRYWINIDLSLQELGSGYRISDYHEFRMAHLKSHALGETEENHEKNLVWN
jgi:hypothetical protein